MKTSNSYLMTYSLGISHAIYVGHSHLQAMQKHAGEHFLKLAQFSSFSYSVRNAYPMLYKKLGIFRISHGCKGNDKLYFVNKVSWTVTYSTQFNITKFLVYWFIEI